MKRRILNRAAGLFSLMFFPAIILAQTDAELWEKIKTAGEAKDYPDSPAVVVFQHTDVLVKESGFSLVSNRSLTKILTSKGIKNYSVLRFNYDPLTNFITLKKLRIFKNDHSIVEVSPDKALDLPQPAGIIFWGTRMKLISLPKLEVGDAVEVETIKKGFKIAYLQDQEQEEEKYIPPMYGTFYDVVYFQSHLPIKEKRYILNLPKDKPIQYEIYNGELRSSVTFCGDTLHYVWEKRDIEPFKHESGMVSFSDVAPKLVIATLPNWYEKSKWFYKVNESSFQVNDDIRRKVEEITAGLKTDEEKISALTHWVAEEVRYLGLSMGKGEGYTVHPAIMTFRDRGGVCKDKAALLTAMLRLAGFEAYVVMTEAGSRVERIPADQFNHCVTCIRRKDGTLQLLDPTWAPNSRELWSSAEAVQHVVYGIPEGEDLSLSPYSSPDENYLRIHGKTILHENGDIVGTIAVVSDGAPDTGIRRWIAATRLADRRHIFEEIVSRISANAQLLEYSFTDPDDFSTPSKITIKYKISSYAMKTGETLWFTPPLAKHLFATRRVTDYLYAAELETRKHPFRLRATRSVEFTEDITLPKGYSVLRTPEKRDLTGRAADFSFTTRVKGRRITIREKLVFKHRWNPADTYKNFKEVVTAAKNLFEDKIIISKSR